MRRAIESFFKLRELNTNIRTEAVAGLTTFMAMAYIIFVNPAMVAQTGMDFAAVMAATCLSAALATVAMGVFVNYPIGLATGMGENAFFTYTVCLGMGVPWQAALGCVFIQGAAFILLTLTKIRQHLIDAIPAGIKYAIACGIGLLITFIGLMNSGLIVANPSTIVALGDLSSPAPALSLLGLAVTGVLLARNMRGAIFWGVIFTALAGIPLGVVKYSGLVSLPPSLAPTFMKMDILAALKPEMLAVIFVFLFMGVFDTVGTLAGVGELGGFMRQGRLPRAGGAMMVDAVGTCVGASCGTPTLACYVESAAGIACGGRSGLASVVTGLLFLAALFFSPLVKMVGGGYQSGTGQALYPVTAPALILVGSMMMHAVTKIEWRDYTESIPAFLAMVMMPLTFSIATGIAVGFVAYAALKLFSGRGKEVSWLVYLLAALFILRFAYLKIA
jgi:AGZA family xanthine/uracil permease-like MFS transporter